MFWADGFWAAGFWTDGFWDDEITVSAAITGTAADGLTEAEVVAGGETIIITLTNDTWVASGATFNAQRQAIIDGLDSNKSEATGWNAEVRDKLGVTSVVRTSDTVVTITLAAAATYDITASETITVTVPSTAVTGGQQIVASPTFDVAAFVAIGHLDATLRHMDQTNRHLRTTLRHYDSTLAHRS